MSDLLHETRYRIAQRWRYETHEDAAEDTLIILGVEKHPEKGIYCHICITLNPPFPHRENAFQDAVELKVAQAFKQTKS